MVLALCRADGFEDYLAAHAFAAGRNGRRAAHRAGHARVAARPLPGHQDGDHLPGQRTARPAGLFSTYVLYDASTGEPLAQIEGNEITSRRTAAASALAASYLAPADARSLVVVGCGRVGSLIPETLRAVHPIERVVVWDRDASAAKALAARLCAQNIEAAVAPDLAKAVNDVDIVSCATLATQPVVQGAWQRPRWRTWPLQCWSTRLPIELRRLPSRAAMRRATPARVRQARCRAWAARLAPSWRQPWRSAAPRSVNACRTDLRGRRAAEPDTRRGRSAPQSDHSGSNKIQRSIIAKAELGL